MKNLKINIITLGCYKNTVDSENLATQLDAGNIEFVFDAYNYDAKTVVINTCGFIADAKEESINTILQFAEAKTRKEIDNLYVIGCLSERYKEDLKNEIPEVDKYFGVNDLKEIVKTLKTDYKKELFGERITSTPKHYAYLKISEGCDRTCSFCAIPLIRGKHKSVSQKLLIKQAENLAKKGVKELILIAQDLSYYGLDIDKKQKLPELVNNLSKIKGIKRVRIHYVYPANFPSELLEFMKNRKNICKYIDIPFQHISDNMLRKMKRGHRKTTILKLIENLRNEIPEIAIRTTLLVGHPGETENDFNELKEFVKTVKFDRLGVFTYSEEEETFSGNNYTDNISAEIKQTRANEIMQIQEQISLELNQNKIGKTYEIVVDKEENDFYIGRTEFDSPEVDNEVLINKNTKLQIGNYYKLKITNADMFDLYGEII